MPNELTFDAERESPEVVDALEALRPDIRNVLSRLRTTPLACVEWSGTGGRVYRLPSHFRTLCCTLDPANADPIPDSEVIVFKGTEPASEGFEEYLHWMLDAKFRASDLSMGLFFPLMLRMPPGAMPADECRREQHITTEVHRRHLQHFGTLAHAPVPLLTYRFSPELNARYAGLVRHLLPAQAFERIALRLDGGLAFSVSYYPTAPIRVENLSLPELEAYRAAASLPEQMEETLAGWIRQLAQLLALGYMPYAPWNRGWGACVDVGNACIDGGFSDLLTLIPFDNFRRDRLFRTSLVQSLDLFQQTVVAFCRAAWRKPDAPDVTFRALVDAFVRPRLWQAIQRESIGGVPDPRIASIFECASITDVLDADTLRSEV